MKMNEIMYTSEGIAWAYKPVGETDPVKVAEAERRFNELFERLEKSIEKTACFRRRSDSNSNVRYTIVKRKGVTAIA